MSEQTAAGCMDVDAQLLLVSTQVTWVEGFFEVVVVSGRSVTTTSRDVAKRAGISDVINFRLEQLITPSFSLQK